MIIYEDETFERRTFLLDEVIFLRCRLKDCNLLFGGGNFEWVDTNYENCRFWWIGAAKSTMMLANFLGFLKSPQELQFMAMRPPSNSKTN